MKGTEALEETKPQIPRKLKGALLQTNGTPLPPQRLRFPIQSSTNVRTSLSGRYTATTAEGSDWARSRFARGSWAST
eukprot:5363810-Pleurochrysis_carterae.AAC.1